MKPWFAEDWSEAKPQTLKAFQIEKQSSTYFHFFVSAPIMSELLSSSSPAIIGLLLLKRK